MSMSVWTVIVLILNDSSLEVTHMMFMILYAIYAKSEAESATSEARVGHNYTYYSYMNLCRNDTLIGIF